MSERTDAYRAACQQRDEALEEVVNTCLPVVLLARILQSTPGRVQIVQIPQAIGIAKAEFNFDGSQWPAAVAINNALAKYHAAIGEAQTAWMNVQIAGEHHGLQPPSGTEWETMRRELLSGVSRQPR
jgi:hypothetical protein